MVKQGMKTSAKRPIAKIAVAPEVEKINQTHASHDVSPDAAPNILNEEVYRKLQWLADAHHFAEEHCDAKITKHADWILIKLLLENDAKGKATVVKHVIEASRCSAGTVRQMFNRFQKYEYIKVYQKIGRSELYRPTAKLRKFVDKWSRASFPK